MNSVNSQNSVNSVYLPVINAAIAAALVLVLSSGCAASNATRATSFYLHENRRVDGVPIREFLQDRSALLIGGEQVNVNLSPVEPDTLTVQSLTNRVGFACATAIDRRGYFLTAAHTLDFGQPWLVFGSKDKPRIERATIVWRGDVSKEKSDLAVLYVPVSLDYVFEWAGQSYTGDAVIQLGLDLESTNNVLQHFAGRIETFQHPKRNPTETVIRTTAPSRPGDSGGPVVTEEGRLLGIAFKGGVQLHGFVVPMWITRFTRVVRPDPDWVREIVDRDAVARAGTNTSVSESH